MCITQASVELVLPSKFSKESRANSNTDNDLNFFCRIIKSSSKPWNEKKPLKRCAEIRPATLPPEPENTGLHRPLQRTNDLVIVRCPLQLSVILHVVSSISPPPTRIVFWKRSLV